MSQRNSEELSIKRTIRQWILKIIRDLHNTTADSMTRKRFRKVMNTDEEKQLSKMMHDDLLHHTYYQTASL